MKAGNKFVIVCAGMIGVGVLLSGAGYLMGGRVWGIGLGAAGIYVNSPNLAQEGENAVAYVKNVEKLEAFDSMDIVTEYGNVDIISSDHYGIEYCVDSRYDFAPEVVNGCLAAKQTNTAQNGGEWTFWGIGGSSVMFGGREDEYIKVYIPKEAALTSVKVYAEAGKVECRGIKADKLELDADFGNMSLYDVQGAETTLLAGSGRLEVDGFTGETLTIVQEFGDVILENVIVGGKSDIKSESGGVTLEKYETDSLIVNCDFGDVDGKEVAATTGNLTLESGTCEIGWTKIKTLTVESDFGDVKLTLPELTENYNLELETDFGDVRVDRADEGAHYHASVTGTDSIAVHCESGSIRIKGVSY